jgi:hypothetical protein
MKLVFDFFINYASTSGVINFYEINHRKVCPYKDYSGLSGKAMRRKTKD